MRWLNDYVKADMPIKEFVADMTMSGSKVETYHKMSDPINNVVVAKVLKLERHPDSEKLWICQLDAGRDEPVQIVTAAQNLFEGAIVPACMHNSTIADGTKITKGKLRGVASNGMMCSYAELGLTKDDFDYPVADDGILILNNDPDVDSFRMGMDICEALQTDDTIVEFEITNNRPDCLSVLGLAQEASATFDIPMNYTEPSFKGVDGDITKEISVSVENTKLCSRYMAALVKNVKIGPSPKWMARRLRASGVRPINNLVDITNFVMLEYGHPMHAFDLRYVEDNRIVVRNAKEGETLKLLDEMAEPVKLTPEMLIIADGKKPIAIAGVMGGEHSGIMEDTTTVVFEAACFDGVSVRRTARKIGERTEASSRFEKGLNPVNAEKALKRALQLIEMLGCGEVVNTIIDVNHSEYVPERLKHDYKWVNEHLGSDIKMCIRDRFITGKILDSFIIGMVYVLLMSIFNMPYAVLCGVVMGIFCIIPYFGPFIGYIPCMLLLVLVDPIQCIYFTIMVVIIQNIDGNDLAPKIIGDSTGLSSFWVIFGMLVGQGLFGFVGLIIGIPLFAVVYSFTKNRVKKRLENKDLPSDSNVYRDIHHIDDETNEPVYFPHPPYMKKEKGKHEFKDIKKIFVKNKNSDSKNTDDKKQK